MKIGGFCRTSLIDYPGQISAVIWTPGCNFRCPFCYNPELVFNQTPLVDEQEVLGYLKQRKGLLDALTITGGEPTLEPDLINFSKKVKNLGYLIKLDTNGTNPKILEKLIKDCLIDYVAMDIKSFQDKYAILSGRKKPHLSQIEKSILIIKTKAPDYEFRTTVVPGLIEQEDILKISQWIKGAKRYVLQQFSCPKRLIDKELEGIKPFSRAYLEQTQKEAGKNVDECLLRGVS